MKENDDLGEQPSLDLVLDEGQMDIEDSVDPDQRALVRKHRARKKALQRKRNRILVLFAAVILVVIAGVLLSPWGPFKDRLYSSGSKGVKQTTNKPHAGTQASKEPASSGPSAPGGTKSKSYFWVTLELDQTNVKRSVVTPPTVAIVVDDVGTTMDPLPLWTAIDAPISFSVMPHLQLSSEVALQLRRAGYQVMMHIPTQNAPPKSFSGTGQLSVGMDRDTVFDTLEADIATVPLVSGINNHQGGLACDDLSLMTYMSEWAKNKGLYVVDSNSSNNSKVTQACLSLGMPKRRNQVFIDHQNEPDYIRGAMRQLADLARKNGTAIGICHWHRPNTPTVVGEMVIELKKEGVNFAFAKDISN